MIFFHCNWCYMMLELDSILTLIPEAEIHLLRVSACLVMTWRCLRPLKCSRLLWTELKCWLLILKKICRVQLINLNMFQENSNENGCFVLKFGCFFNPCLFQPPPFYSGLEYILGVFLKGVNAVKIKVWMMAFTIASCFLHHDHAFSWINHKTSHIACRSYSHNS